FYVYQYATGIAASSALAKQILTEGQPAVERYLRFLRAGSSDYSINQLRDAGVDLSTPRPVQEALDTFAQYLDEFELLLGASPRGQPHGTCAGRARARTKRPRSTCYTVARRPPHATCILVPGTHVAVAWSAGAGDDRHRRRRPAAWRARRAAPARHPRRPDA